MLVKIMGNYFFALFVIYSDSNMWFSVCCSRVFHKQKRDREAVPKYGFFK